MKNEQLKIENFFFLQFLIINSSFFISL